MPEPYGPDYFERGVQSGVSLYENYHWMPEATCAMAMAMIDYLPILPDEQVLDFGCAKGYLVRALRILRRRAWGMDCSLYAIASADQDTWPFLFYGDLPGPAKWDWIICNDILEHVAGIEDLLQTLRISARRIFAVVPLGDGARFIIPDYDADATHLWKRPAPWWDDQFQKAGFEVERFSCAVPGIKERWTRKYPKGNGFWVLK